MATIEHKFASLQRDYPSHSSLINFVRAIKGQPVSQRRLAFLFSRLVEPDDYAKEDRREILRIWVLSELKSEKTATQKQGFFDRRKHKTALKPRALVWAD